MQVLGAVHLSYLSRQDKLKLAFEHLDLDGNGELDMKELQARDPLPLAPDNTPRSVRVWQCTAAVAFAEGMNSVIGWS